MATKQNVKKPYKNIYKKFKYQYTKEFLKSQIKVKQNRDYLMLDKDDPLRIAKQNELDQIDMFRMEFEKFMLLNKIPK